MTTEMPKLHTYFRSSASWRVRLALNWKNIAYEPVVVNLLKGEQHGEDYAKINPLAQAPILEIDGAVLAQSMAIMEYLEERFPERPILPKDLIQRAHVRHAAEIVNSGIQPLQNLSVLKKLYGDDLAKYAEHAAFYIARGFNALEKLLQSTSGQYCVGDQVSVADFCLVPQVAAAVRFKVDMNEYPTIQRITATLKELPAFQKADQFAQADCPEDAKPK